MKNGIRRAEQIRKDFEEWMDAHEYESVERKKGVMSHKRLGNPHAFIRANYIRALKEYRVKSAETW